MYDKQKGSLVENPMMNDPRSMIDPRYYNVNNRNPARIQQQPANERRIQFQRRWQFHIIKVFFFT